MSWCFCIENILLEKGRIFCSIPANYTFSLTHLMHNIHYRTLSIFSLSLIIDLHCGKNTKLEKVSYVLSVLCSWIAYQVQLAEMLFYLSIWLSLVIASIDYCNFEETTSKKVWTKKCMNFLLIGIWMTVCVKFCGANYWIYISEIH